MCKYISNHYDQTSFVQHWTTACNLKVELIMWSPRTNHGINLNPLHHLLTEKWNSTCYTEPALNLNGFHDTFLLVINKLRSQDSVI
jgi:hypothetical protein